MGNCGDDFDYQMIEMADLFDLRDGRLVRAEINSIDAINNSADITLLDSCEALSGKATSSVPFFYHCEDSTGTIEDLARGNKAFKVGEMVYILFAPTRGDTPERFYIIGHVDIRSTKPCSGSDYLFIFTGEPYTDIGTSYRWLTIFDVAAGTVLDLSTFESLGETPPPSGFPLRYTYDVHSWIIANFEIVTPKSYFTDSFTKVANTLTGRTSHFEQVSGTVLDGYSNIPTSAACGWVETSQDVNYPTCRTEGNGNNACSIGTRHSAIPAPIFWSAASTTASYKDFSGDNVIGWQAPGIELYARTEIEKISTGSFSPGNDISFSLQHSESFFIGDEPLVEETYTIAHTPFVGFSCPPEMRTVPVCSEPQAFWEARNLMGELGAYTILGNSQLIKVSAPLNLESYVGFDMFLCTDWTTNFLYPGYNYTYLRDELAVGAKVSAYLFINNPEFDPTGGVSMLDTASNASSALSSSIGAAVVALRVFSYNDYLVLNPSATGFQRNVMSWSGIAPETDVRKRITTV